MKLFQKLARSLSDIAEEEDINFAESLAKSQKYSNLISSSRLYNSWKNMIDCDLSQQRFIHLRQFRNSDTTYLMYDLWDESDQTESDDCLISNRPSLREHPEDLRRENSSIDDHSSTASVDFYPSTELNQLDKRHSFTSSLSLSSQNHQQYCYQNLELSSHSILSFPEKTLTHPVLDYSTTATEDSYLTPSTSKLLHTDTITKANFPEQNQSRSVTPRANNSQEFLSGEPSDSDSDFPAPPDYLLSTKIRKQSVISVNNLYGRSDYINMKSISSNNSLSTTKREPLSSLTGKRNTSATAMTEVSSGMELCREQSANVTTAMKFPTLRQTNSPSHNYKTITETNGDNAQNVIDNSNKSKQVTSPYLPHTSTALSSSIQARGHLVGTIDGIYPRTSPKFSRTNRLTNEIHETAVPKSHLKTVDIQFEDKPGAAYQPSNIDRNNTKMGSQNGIGEVIDVKINLNNDDGNDTRKHFGFTVTGGKDKNAPVKIDAVIVGTPADQAGLQVGDLLLSINGESLVDRYYQCVVRMLHEAERVGDIDLMIRRSDNAVIGPRLSAENPSAATDQQSTISFDQKRALFDDKCTIKNNSCKGIRKQKHSPVRKWSTGNFNKHPENAPSVTVAAVTHNVKDGIVTRSNSFLSSFSTPDDDDPRMAYVSGKYVMRHSRERFSSRTSLASSTSCSITGGGGDPDYRVTSLHDKPKPGKLADFIPEVERKTDAGYDQDDGASAYSSSFSRRESDVDGFTNLFTSEDDGEVPLVLRNYDITPVRSVTTSPIQHKISYWMKKDEAKTMSLPRNIGGEYRRNGYVIPCNLPNVIKSTIQREVIMPEENSINDNNDQTKTTNSRDWRQIIEQQRLPSPGDPDSRNRIDADSKFQVRPNKDTETSYGSLCGNKKITRHLSQSEVAQMKKSNSGIENLSSADHFRKSSENNRSIASNSNRAYASNETNSRKEITKPSSNTDEPLLSVSGKHRCSHCNMELGRGAAMIIESLNLFYHLSCFRCYVCKMTLGNGTRGTDVRVRDSKLHCQSCYSSEESGLKFSKV
ncbi:PDZ domain (Also known as DHR or GLGF) family protein [Acanthocheilonema viteae]